jgi:hypothetical protein
LHSEQLYGLIGICALLSGVYGYLHARRYWEGLPPILDGFVSMAAFVVVAGAFVVGGRIGIEFGGHVHAGRVVGVMLALIGVRVVRTWLGREQERYRKAKPRD